MGRVKETLIDGYDKVVNIDELYKIEVLTIDGTLYTILKDELDIIDGTYIQHSINGDFISYSRIVQLHKVDTTQQYLQVTQIFLKHIISIQTYYSCDKVQLK